MATIIAAVVGALVLGWFLRRLFPALAAAAMVVLAPLWLVGGFVLDLLRKLPDAFHRLGRFLAQCVGFILALPLLPFVFLWAFIAELWRQFRPSGSPAAAGEPDTPMQAATRRTADVIDLATFRQRRNGGKE